MRLLICTQKVKQYDNNLGFFHGWLREFAHVCERVTVICLEKGEFDLPANVTVFSLGKEEGVSKVKYINNFYRYIWRERHNYDAVFVHMNPEYLVLGGWLWRLMGKKTALWYTHHSVTWSLRVGVQFTDMIFTAARESFRLRTRKPIYALGHGIDTDHFKPKAKTVSDTVFTQDKDKRCQTPFPRILVDARISRSKNLETVLDISALLMESNCHHEIMIVGAAITPEDIMYSEELQKRIDREHLPVMLFQNAPYPEMPAHYNRADLMINLANVGGLNKSVLQAMACNLYVLTSNEAYRGILPDEQIVSGEPKVFAESIIQYCSHSTIPSYREIILRNHSLPQLVSKFFSLLDCRVANK